ncbi:MAG TPA: hypothetical protein ACFCUC_05960 [Desulfobacterales bacterium]
MRRSSGPIDTGGKKSYFCSLAELLPFVQRRLRRLPARGFGASTRPTTWVDAEVSLPGCFQSESTGTASTGRAGPFGRRFFFESASIRAVGDRENPFHLPKIPNENIDKG